MTTPLVTPYIETNATPQSPSSPHAIRTYLLSLCRYWTEHPPPLLENEVLSWLQTQQGYPTAQVIAEISRLMVDQGHLTIAVSLLSVAKDIAMTAEDAYLWQQSSLCREYAALLLQTEQYPAALAIVEQAMSWFPSLDTDPLSLESSVRKEWLDLHLLYAQTLLRMNRLKSAEQVTRLLLQRWPGPVQQVLERADVLHLLGEILRQYAEWTATQDTLPEAEQYLVEALATRQRLLPSSHAKLAESLQALALLRRAQGRHDAQQRLLADASHLVETLYTGQHPAVAILCLDQAICALEEGRLQHTLDHCARAIEIFQHFDLTILPSVALAHYLEAAVYRVSGQWQMSQEVYLYAEEILQHYPPHALPFQLRRLQHHNIFEIAITSFLSSQHEYAYVALQEHDLPKAAQHLQLALRTDPFHPQNWAILDMLVQQSPSWESLAPPSHTDPAFDNPHSYPPHHPMEPTWYMIQVALYGQQMRYDEVWTTLGYLQQYPQSGLSRWVLLWFERYEMTSHIGADKIIPFLAETLDCYPGRLLSPQAQQELSACLPAVQSLLQHYPEHAEIASLASSLYRKLGHFEQALWLAKHACRLEPSWRSVVVLALCYETLQQWDDAIINYEVALADCPNPIPILLDLADLLRRLHRWHDAIQIYDTVLGYEAEHEKALPCLLYCHAVSEPTPDHFQQWQHYCRQHPDNPWLLQLQHEHHL